MWGRRHTRFSATISSEGGSPFALEYTGDVRAGLRVINISGGKWQQGVYVYCSCEIANGCNMPPPRWLIELVCIVKYSIAVCQASG